ncbi:CBL-interacting serine/threonine-protein kinase 11 [Punica granatum]|uniref:non-specific serine/threonine protein kinase n=2 Tax=Punica granatum TaxID=22663 RepID=A0A218W327_PUNGR|nr:CBL-interacting serine/threonine-protein kinase 11 [Punica granatum]OWM66641.1 hypothetical protein CDL15_Pgr010292 [Punica granatum]PKI54668.1 hypothetical protein CRG98_024953 [Punica granatum]
MAPEIEHAPVTTPNNIIINNRDALFGKYEVGRLLGCGAFAKVYHARDVRTGQSVAVKVINKKKLSSSSSTSTSTGLAANIKREISIMSRLHHANIVRLHEVLASKSKIYFVLEFVKGGELFAKVSKGRLSEDLSRHYFRQLISAVGYCHSRGVFHRDLKPENLLLDDAGNLKVSDFGLSAVRDQIRPDGLLHTLCGTPAYVAPEILTKRGYDGAKVDVWSCGVILYVLTAGYLPFNDPNLMALYKKIYKGEFRCPRWMSPDLKRFLHRLLDTNPDTRITIHEILRDPWFKKPNSSSCRREKDPQGQGRGATTTAAIDFYGEDIRSAQKAMEAKATSLNAFDLISFSSGLDLSGLFDDSYNSTEDGERFVSGVLPEKLIEKVEGFAREEGMRVKRYKEWDLGLEGQNGNFVIDVGLYRLTDSLVVVEVKRGAGEATAYRDVWKDKLKPLLLELDRSTTQTASQLAEE